MERIKRVVFCGFLKKDVHTTYFIQNNTHGNGIVTSKTVAFYNCGSKNKCVDTYHVLDCPSFKETRKVEMELNSISSH